jgi:N-acetylneuraminic acid mutarotase
MTGISPRLRCLQFLLMIVMVLTVSCQTERGESTSPETGWQGHKGMITPRSEMPAASLDGKIFVPGGFGGESVFEAYDVASDTWETLPSLPEGRHHLMAAALGGKIYIFGGGRSVLDWTPSAKAYAFDPLAAVWTVVNPMLESRLGGAAVTLDDYIYILGGVGGSGALLRYDPADNSWDSLASPAQAREHTAAVALDGLIYAVGGRWAGVGELSSVEVYDPIRDEWSSGGTLNRARAGHAAAVVGESIVVLGGEVLSSGRETLDSVEIFNPQEGIWKTVEPMPISLHGVPAVGIDGMLYVIGGSDRAGGIENRGRVLSWGP